MNPIETSTSESKSLLVNKNLSLSQTAFQSLKLLKPLGKFNVEPKEENVNYYQESCRLYIANVILTTQMKELLAEKNELLNRIKNLEKKIQETSSSSIITDEKRKRNRRSANEIQKHYRCPVANCTKAYGSEGSMLQHVKLKHADYKDCEQDA